MTGSRKGNRRDPTYYPAYNKADSGPAVSRKINRKYQGISTGAGFQGAGRSGRSGKSEGQGSQSKTEGLILHLNIADGASGIIELDANAYDAVWARFNFTRGANKGMGLIVAHGSSASADLAEVWFNHPEIDAVTAAVVSGVLTITIDAGTHGADLKLVLSVQGVEVIT